MYRCGSCAVRVNGRPALACHKRVTDLQESRELVIEPLTCFPLIKDLLVDFSADLFQRAMLRPFPEAAGAGLETPGLTAADGNVLRQYTACTRCAICVEACAARRGRGEPAPNPMHLLELARLAQDPRDRACRTLEALSEGLDLCDRCNECNRVCPLGLSVYELSVGRLRVMLAASV
jgi:succinate dehydrogenase/fumarate reductase iron-sulfur protein